MVLLVQGLHLLFANILETHYDELGNEGPHLISGPEFERSFAGIEDRILMGHIHHRSQDPEEASRPQTTEKQTSTNEVQDHTWKAKQSGPATAISKMCTEKLSRTRGNTTARTQQGRNGGVSSQYRLFECRPPSVLVGGILENLLLFLIVRPPCQLVTMVSFSMQVSVVVSVRS